ncbi:hypothetical protein [Streptomyces griseoaurantiacus]|uniref:hypothetical protein n=1 Tax=Streptomyces griseoaurantiacus TaxID=68213 RepID=UPI003248F16D
MASGDTGRTTRSVDRGSDPGTAPGVRAVRLLKRLIDHQLGVLRAKQQLDEQQAADAWRELVRRQLRRDRDVRERSGQPRLPGRMTVVHPVTFQRLYAELERPDTELGRDRQASSKPWPTCARNLPSAASSRTPCPVS